MRRRGSIKESLGRDLVADTVEQAPAPVETTPQRAPRWRRILSATLVVLGCIFAPLAIHAVWIHNTLLNTDQYVATVSYTHLTLPTILLV